MTVQGGLTSGKELYCWNNRGGIKMGEKINNILKGEIISSVFYILLGLCLILIPTQTVDVICKVVFGLILIGVGIYHIYIYIRGKATATIMDLLSGVVVFVLGVFLFMTPSIVIKLLPWMLSAFVLVDSLWKFKGAFLLKKGGRGAWSVLLIGSLVFIALGIVMLFGRFPKIMTLLIFSGWVLVCDGAADIVFFIIMKLGLRKIAKKAEAEKEEAGADSSEAVDDKVDMDTQNDTKTQDGNDPQSGNAPKYSANTATENMAVETATTEPEKKSRRGILRKKEKVQERTGNSITEQNEQENALKDSSASDFSSENATESTGEPTQDTEGSTNRKVTEEVTEPAEKPKQENSRWEKEPENVEMKLWDVGKDQVETGSLKDLLDGSDEDLEEWKD